MIVKVESHNAHNYRNLIDKMHKLRAYIFRDRLGWDVQVVEGRERDKYDDEQPLYIIYTDDQQREVRGSLRLLPTTGPTLLSECFADTLPDAAHLSAPTIWECTRFCIDDRLLDRESSEGLLFVSAKMLVGLGEVAISKSIESIIGNLDASMLRLYRRIGCEVEILGSTSRYDRRVYLGLFPVTELLLGRVKRRLANARPAVERMEKMVA
jgi:N-acyl-L-homoserine lactone synthetase